MDLLKLVSETFHGSYMMDFWWKWKIMRLSLLSMEDAEDIYIIGIMVLWYNCGNRFSTVWDGSGPGLSQISTGFSRFQQKLGSCMTKAKDCVWL